MQLREFIQSTLIDVLSAINDAQNELKSTFNNGAINPVWDISGATERIHNLEFDIAVTVGNVKSGETKAGINVLGLDIGGAGNLQFQNSSVSRIKFSIPILAPVQIVTGINPVMS